MGLLVLVRHGESRWNLDDKFTGWVDVPLSEEGIAEADECGLHCRNYKFDRAYTSRLERAHETLQIILSVQDRTGITQHKGIYFRYRSWIQASNKLSNGDLPVFTSELLNERYYGLLQGMKKRVAEQRFGKEQVFKWRRGYKDKPPKGESLQQAFHRIMPYFTHEIFPHVANGEQVLLVAHGNTLRAIIKHIERISDHEIADIDLPEAKPIVYHYTRTKGWKWKSGSYTHDRPLR